MPIKLTVGVDFFADRKPFIKSLIHSLNLQTFRDFELIFMDDGPECGALEELKKLEHFFPIKYYYVNRRPENETLENLSFLACGNLTNFVVDNMESSMYIRCDPEMMLPVEILRAYHTALWVSLKNNIKIFFTCARYCLTKSDEEFMACNWNNIPAIIQYCESKYHIEAGYFSTMAISKADFQNIGKFTTEEKGWGGIDMDFSVKAKNLGYVQLGLHLIPIHQYHKRNTEYKSGGPDYPITDPKLTILEPNL